MSEASLTKMQAAEADVVIDFSLHDATLPIARVCSEHRKALVIGTTGHSDADKAAIMGSVEKAAERFRIEVPEQDAKAITEMEKRGL